MFRNILISLVLLGVVYTVCAQVSTTHMPQEHGEFESFTFLYEGSTDTTTHMPQEHGESESFSFLYEGSTHLMLMLNDKKCYIWQLSTTEKAHVHTDAGSKAIELRLLKQVNSAYFSKVPQMVLNTRVISQCTNSGHRHVDFYLVH